MLKPLSLPKPKHLLLVFLIVIVIKILKALVAEIILTTIINICKYIFFSIFTLYIVKDLLVTFTHAHSYVILISLEIFTV